MFAIWQLSSNFTVSIACPNGVFAAFTLLYASIAASFVSNGNLKQNYCPLRLKFANGEPSHIVVMFNSFELGFTG